MNDPPHAGQRSRPIAVRAAQSSDVDGLSSLYDELLQSYGHDPGAERTQAFIAQLLQTQWVRFFVAIEAAGSLIGFIGCGLTYSAVSQRLALTINDLFVRQADRRRGAATALIEAAEDYARSNGMAKLFVEADTSATFVIALYERSGFEKLPHLTLKKELGNGP